MTTGPLPWIVLTPLAVLTDLLSVTILCHYRCHFHGTDVVFISILVCMVLNALVIPLTPSLLNITNSEWNENLCNFFVWTALTTRMVQVSNLALLSFHWSKILRTSTKRIKVSTTTTVKIVVPIFWGVAAVVGLLPVIGAVPDNFKTKNDCLFLLSDLGLGFLIFMMVFILTMTCISLVCSFDSIALIHYAKKIAFIKYGAGRFYLPRKNDGLAENYTVHERYGQLNFAADLCRLVTIVTCFSFTVNHLPCVVIEFLYMSIGTDRGLSEDLVTWLSLIEALVLPYFLWFGSRRYKHAITYVFKVHILRRDHDNEENPDSCTLQSFTRKIKDVQTLPRKVHVPNNLSPSERTSRSSSTRGRLGESSMEFNIQNKVRACNLSKVNVDVHSNGGSIDSRDMSQFHRSGSSGSRNDQDRKKNLPSIFINDTLKSASPKRMNTEAKNEVVLAAHKSESGSMRSMYYMSSDYHPDCLNTDSLPRIPSKGYQESYSNPTTITDGRIYLERYGSNSFPRLYEESTGIYSGSFGSIPRKKPPKMGLRSNSGSSSSLYQTHSRSSSGNVYIYGHSRSASGTIFKSSNITLPSTHQIQVRGRVVPRQSSERSESEGVAGQYCESDIDNVLENSSMRSEEIQNKPVEIHSVTFIERPQIFYEGEKLRRPLTRQEQFYPHQKDKEQLSDENDSGCMANCAEEHFECNLNIHKQSNSAATIACESTDAELDGFTTSELLSSQPYSYLSSNRKNKRQIQSSRQHNKSRLPWINPDLPDSVPDLFDREKSVEYAFFNNQCISSSESTGISTSPRFDENTDRGFEEALNASYNSRESLCSCNGAYVESVSECTDMGEFFDNHQCDDSFEFKTQAIVSRISPASLTDPFSEHDDSVFAESKVRETGLYFSKDRKEGSCPDSSPWPKSTKNSNSVDLSFESNFSNERQVPDGVGPYQDIEAVYF
ncbi:uncharacterized protein LOC133171580 [Saccostrea echinata]|uniref:uncharacterized protein LOC133171580 n=1 Tax=Saccostrea echinata TaxID=191078 RepID=UPI002A83CCB7|nr:uncharacterized protein LOC133171580 [Saccostrea echinata]XP_061162335.1 uncharacterized protein LOC133171580 [Saccostrea echinata]